ncbi:hypothetical protein AYK24_02795 [Thermoplasmatales archaeon SG8-52-4]|nr:MAG: hypothetical protein AYK24_02795 [Thermoplasmatales archaeon SG8-52-4]
MLNRRFFRFSYYVRRQQDRKLLPHQLRDGDAFAQLSEVLHYKNYQYGGLILNYPATDPSRTRRINTSFLKSADILVLTTRPPLHDEDTGDRKLVVRSHTSLEEKIFNALRRHFKRCSRSRLRLDDALALKLPKEFANRADIRFTQHRGAQYKRLRRHDTLRWDEDPKYSNLTSLYFIFTGEICRNGPRVLCAFGMGGTDSLIWSHLLRTKFRHEVKLDRPKIIIVEIKTGRIPEKANSLSFADNWETKVLLNEYL